MTSLEPPHPVPDDDSLDAAASALVDGIATPEEAALVAASPGGAARLAALREVSEAVGRPGPEQDPSAAASALAAALAAFDAAGAGQASDGSDREEAQGLGAAPERKNPGPSGQGSGSAAAPDPASPGEIPGSHRPGSADDEDGDGGDPAGEGLDNVHALAPRRGSPTSASWLPRLGAVAAALVLLVGIAVLTVDLLGKVGDSGTPPNLAAGPTSVAAAPPGAGAAAMAKAEGGQSTIIDGGSFGNETAVEAIALRAAAALDNPPVSGPSEGVPPGSDLERCLGAVATTMTDEVRGPLYQAEGTFQGVPALAIAYDRDRNPPRLLLVLARSDCALLERTPF